MATTSLWPINMTINNTINYVEDKDKTKIPLSNLSKIINYAENKDKTEEQFYVTGINCDSDNAYKDMMRVKKAYNKLDGIQGFHGYQSFEEGEVTPNVAHNIGIQFVKEMWGDEFQVVVTTHLNTNHIHNHFVINSVSIKDGHKYNYSNKEMARLRNTNDLICDDYGVSYLKEKPTPKKHIDFRYYLNHDNYSTRTKKVIDMAINNSYSYENFLELMKEYNYEVIERYGKLSVRSNDKNRNIRIERQFGSDYSIEKIKKQILGLYLPEHNKTYSNYFKKDNIIDILFKANLKGLAKSYIRYLKILNKYPKYIKKHKLSYEMKKDILKIDQISEETILLVENKIENKEDFDKYYQSIIEQLKNDKTNSILIEKKKICNRIKNRCSKVEETINKIEKEVKINELE